MSVKYRLKHEKNEKTIKYLKILIDGYIFRNFVSTDVRYVIRHVTDK